MQITKDSQHLLVIDDDDRIRNLLQKYLVEQGYFISSVKDAIEAELFIQNFQCNLIILDLMLPGINGIDFAKIFRQMDKYSTPIIMLTAKGEANDRIEGLESGADDYLVKPFEPRELLLRISNLLKRTLANLESFHFGDFSYNAKKQILLQENNLIPLTQSEHCLLNFLLKNEGSVINRTVLANELNVNERSVDVQIIRLRNKIESSPSRPRFLQTSRNQGYVFRV